MSRDIVMTIKPRHIRNMRLGLKRYELRKNQPGQSAPFRVWICESGSGGRVVARFNCPAVTPLSGRDDATIAQTGCITMSEAQGYRKKGQLFGWKVADFDYFRQTDRLHITDFGLDRPPQSWCYAKEVPGDV